MSVSVATEHWRPMPRTCWPILVPTWGNFRASAAVWIAVGYALIA
jgi:hypothetical protein